jgi:hypothetical protein
MEAESIEGQAGPAVPYGHSVRPQHRRADRRLMQVFKQAGVDGELVAIPAASAEIYAR